MVTETAAPLATLLAEAERRGAVNALRAAADALAEAPYFSVGAELFEWGGREWLNARANLIAKGKL